MFVKNNRDRSCNGVLLKKKKQIGGNRDGRNQSTKIHFDSLIKDHKSYIKEKEGCLDFDTYN